MEQQHKGCEENTGINSGFYIPLLTTPYSNPVVHVVHHFLVNVMFILTQIPRPIDPYMYEQYIYIYMIYSHECRYPHIPL